MTYADVHKLVPDVGKNVVPQLGDQNEKRKHFAEETKLKENFEEKVSVDEISWKLKKRIFMSKL